jgi:putative lipoic acid-binding regulatory protein
MVSALRHLQQGSFLVVRTDNDQWREELAEIVVALAYDELSANVRPFNKGGFRYVEVTTSARTVKHADTIGYMDMGHGFDGPGGAE